MGFLQTVAHYAGQPVGWGAQAAGAALSLGGNINNSEANRLTSIGHAITNPNMSLSNPGAILNSQQSAFSPIQGNTAPVNRPVQGAQSGAPAVPNSGPYTGALGASTGINNGVLKSYDTQIGGFQDLLNTLQPAQNAATLQAQNQYQNQRNALEVQHGQGVRDLTSAGQQVEQQKARSLQDIAHQLQSSAMGYANQLGAYGAGNSSAAPLIQQALTGLASRNRGDVLQGASQQTQQIGNQMNDLENEYQTNARGLDDWKSQMFNDIAQQYAQQRLNLQQQIAGAQGQKAQYLAQQGQALDQGVLDSLSQLQNQYKQYTTDLISRYQNPTGPNVQIDPSLSQYQVQAINPGQIAQLAAPQPAGDTVDNSGAFFNRRFQDQFQPVAF